MGREYFHGDDGAGIGASHQTGWTGLVARVLDIFGRVDAATGGALSRDELISRMTRESAAGVEEKAG